MNGQISRYARFGLTLPWLDSELGADEGIIIHLLRSVAPDQLYQRQRLVL